MRSNPAKFAGPMMLAFLVLACADANAALVRIGTYNLESYLDQPLPTRSAKSGESKAKIRESILQVRPDILALQELGSESALLELRDSLSHEGLDLQHWLLLSGKDTNIHLAILSKIPFENVRPHTNESFLLNGRRFHVSRGFAEIDFRLETGFRFTLFAAHLKSKRAAIEADESALRLEEAVLVREAIDGKLNGDAQANVVVLGDFNDTRDSETIKTIIGRGRNRLVDTRPAEWNPQSDSPRHEVTGRSAITWTHFYSKEDSFFRVDYILISKGMARAWAPGESGVLSTPDWGIASDHRPVWASFEIGKE